MGGTRDEVAASDCMVAAIGEDEKAKWRDQRKFRGMGRKTNRSRGEIERGKRGRATLSSLKHNFATTKFCFRHEFDTSYPSPGAPTSYTVSSVVVGCSVGFGQTLPLFLFFLSTEIFDLLVTKASDF